MNIIIIKMMRMAVVQFLVFVSLMIPSGALMCSRHPANTLTAKLPVDENFVISIGGHPKTYILGQEYNVSINGYNDHRYVSFMLALENENGDFSYSDDLGHFELSDTVETRFSPNCVNMVENTNTNPKTHTHVTWVAPAQSGSGCILMRATVVQQRDVWHMDDGGLTRRICEEVVDEVESKPMIATDEGQCCACDDARYELTFEGSWSRNLHPKDFPDNVWKTRFCELVGATHSADYRFWQYGELASENMKLYAEDCSTQQLEQEFNTNFQEQKIRTIIRARGPAYPHIGSKSMASVRVDPTHHMLSFASKIQPSPDWIVGVSGLELCLSNCTWLESKQINLYPWDIGTDAGPSYLSSNQLQVPPDVIKRISSNTPHDPRSPFYDESGEPMKPMAMLTIRRQRIYERRCMDEESNNDIDAPRECSTHPWSKWSLCTSKCGEGTQYRRRVYKQLDLARIYNCNVSTNEQRSCEGQSCGPFEASQISSNYDDFTNEGRGGGVANMAACEVSAWSAWGPCSVTCGEGWQTRQRQFLNPYAEAQCQSVHRLRLTETQHCAGRACLGNVASGDEQLLSPSSEVTPFKYNFDQNYDTELTNDNDNRKLSFESADLRKGNNNLNWSGYKQSVPPTIRQQQPIYNHIPISSNYKTSTPPQHERLDDIERSQWRNPYDRRKLIVDPTNSENMRCFQTLQTTSHRCHNQTVIGNYWFYNFCADECMLYAADICDRNVNKFTKWEVCEEHCRKPEYAVYLNNMRRTQCMFS